MATQTMAMRMMDPEDDPILHGYPPGSLAGLLAWQRRDPELWWRIREMQALVSDQEETEEE